MNNPEVSSFKKPDQIPDPQGKRDLPPTNLQESSPSILTESKLPYLPNRDTLAAINQERATALENAVEAWETFREAGRQIDERFEILRAPDAANRLKFFRLSVGAVFCGFVGAVTQQPLLIVAPGYLLGAALIIELCKQWATRARIQRDLKKEPKLFEAQIRALKKANVAGALFRKSFSTVETVSRLPDSDIIAPWTVFRVALFAVQDQIPQLKSRSWKRIMRLCVLGLEFDTFASEHDEILSLKGRPDIERAYIEKRNAPIEFLKSRRKCLTLIASYLRDPSDENSLKIAHVVNSLEAAADRYEGR